MRRVVLLSASAVPEGAPGLGTVHRYLRERVPEWAVLQPSWFMQNFVNERHHHGSTLKHDGVVVTATGEGRVGFVVTANPIVYAGGSPLTRAAFIARLGILPSVGDQSRLL